MRRSCKASSTPRRASAAPRRRSFSGLEDGLYRFAAGYSLDPKYIEIEKAALIAPGPGTAVGRAAMNKQVVRIDDALSNSHYAVKDDAKIGDVRSMIGVPLMREGEPIGVIALARSRVEPFNEREIDLVTTFADQAVIAIENVRLFDEVRERTEDLSESLQQQTATTDVLKVISRSTFDLQPVLDTLIESCDAAVRGGKRTIHLRSAMLTGSCEPGLLGRSGGICARKPDAGKPW